MTWLPASELPIDRIRYVGIEYMTVEGVKALNARAAERAPGGWVSVVVPQGRGGEPYDFTLTTLDGKQIRAADLRGRIVLIDCWSMTYNPRPAGIKQLYEKYHKDGLEIIGICLGHDAEGVKKFCADHGMTWPQVFVPVPDEKTRLLWIEATGLHRGRDALHRPQGHPGRQRRQQPAPPRGNRDADRAIRWEGTRNRQVGGCGFVINLENAWPMPSRFRHRLGEDHALAIHRMMCP